MTIRPINQTDGVRVIPAGYDVVHVSGKSRDDDQSHMNRQKAQVTHQQNKMDGARSLPAPEELWEKETDYQPPETSLSRSTWTAVA